MNETIQRMDYHQSLLNKSVSLTEKMIKAAQKENIELVTELADNRQRLLDIINQAQADIEKKLEQNIGTRESSFIRKANSWISNTQIFIQEIARLDEILLEELNQVKENTIKEVSKVYKQKKSIQGYNLNNVKR